MDTPSPAAASPAPGASGTPAAPEAAAHPQDQFQAHLQAMADAEDAVAASEGVVAQAVHGTAPPRS